MAVTGVTDTVVACSYRERLAALDGVKTLFMMSATESADRLSEHFAFVGAAVEAGVEHIVHTSFFGAAQEATFTWPGTIS